MNDKCWKEWKKEKQTLHISQLGPGTTNYHSSNQQITLKRRGRFWAAAKCWRLFSALRKSLLSLKTTAFVELTFRDSLAQDPWIVLTGYLFRYLNYLCIALHLPLWITAVTFWGSFCLFWSSVSYSNIFKAVNNSVKVPGKTR